MLSFKQFRKLQEDAGAPVGHDFRLIHYAKSPLSHLSTNYHGTGISDAADKRLRSDGESNSPIAKRIYFYTQKHNNKLPIPEQGLGAHAHEADPASLKLFDHTKATQEEKTALRSKHNEFVQNKGVSSGTAHELAIHHLGYDGYVNHDAGMAVVLGHNKTVPVKHLGHKEGFELENNRA